MDSHKTNYFTLLLVIAAALIILFVFSRFYTNIPEEVEKEIVLYFSDENAMYLSPENRTIKTTTEKKTLYKDTLEELIKGPNKEKLNRTIPEGVKILKLNIKNNILEINFNKALRENHWGGSTGEQMTVYSIVNTLTEFEDIKEIKFLIEGQKVESLVGHLDLTEPLERNEKIIKD